jgi:hypothetical protein
MPCRAAYGGSAAGASDHGGAGRRCRGGSPNAAATELPPAGVSCPGRTTGDQPAGTGASPPQSPDSGGSRLQTPPAATGAAPCRCRCPGAAAQGPGGEDRRQLRSSHRPPQGGFAAAGDDRTDQGCPALRPFTGPLPALWPHLRQWGDHALPAGQWLPAQGAADVAGNSCAGAAIADFWSRCGGDAGANRNEPRTVDSGC